MHRNRRVFLQPFLEIVPLQNPRDGVFRAQPHDIFVLQRLQPFAVKSQLRFFAIENLEHLRLVRLGVAIQFLARHRRTSNVAARRIPDQSRHIADQENHRVPQVLKMLHFSQQHRVAQVQIGSRRIEPRFHAQRLSRLQRLLQTLLQILLANDFRESFPDVGELFLHGRKVHTPIVK
jgi:hypothetical protein